MASSSITASAMYSSAIGTPPAGSAMPRTSGFLFPLPLTPALWLSDNGVDPAQWTDMSGNGRHAIQNTGANQPAIVTNVLNGRQVRRFDGTNDGMTGTMTLSQPFTIITVAKHDVTGSTQSVFHGANCSLGIQGGVGFFLYAGAVISSAGSNTNFNINTHIFNGTSSAIFSDEVSLVSGNANTAGVANFSIGFRSGSNDEFVDGDIAEIIVFSAALTTAQREQVEAYLNNKYSIY